MTIAAFIFARGGSKGIKDKNLSLINGKPLIVHAIECARKSLADRVYCSTDSDQIAYAANQAGADIIKRPAELATDTSPEWLSWQHAVKEANLAPDDIFVCTPATSPLRKPEDIDACISGLSMPLRADLVLTITPSTKNPFYFCCRPNKQGFLERFTMGSINHRQDAPEVYNVAGSVYATTPGFILRTNSMWEGCVMGVPVPPERSIDIDTPLDLKIAQALYEA